MATKKESIVKLERLQMRGLHCVCNDHTSSYKSLLIRAGLQNSDSQNHMLAQHGYNSLYKHSWKIPHLSVWPTCCRWRCWSPQTAQWLTALRVLIMKTTKTNLKSLGYWALMHEMPYPKKCAALKPWTVSRSTLKSGPLQISCQLLIFRLTIIISMWTLPIVCHLYNQSSLVLLSQ